jgi:nucleoside phosphorylase
MIKILIVEDSDYKLSAVLNLLTEEILLSRDLIDTATDIKSAKRLLKANFYDLLILDLVLPLDKDDSPAPEKSVRFLNDINSIESLNPPVHIIGLTEFDEFKDKFAHDFSDNLWHLINYKASEINWQEKLTTLINHLISTRSRFLNKLSIENEKDVAIITALNSPEFDQVLALSSDWQTFELPGDSTKYHSTIFSKGDKKLRILAACADQMGMTATASLTTKISIAFKPKYIFMAGICAGVRGNDLNFGDIIIADQSWDYGSGKIREVENKKIFEPDPRPILLNHELVAKMNHFLRKQEIRIQIQTSWRSGKKSGFVLNAKLGPVASGAYVVAAESILHDIKTHQRKVLGVEMEGYGLYFAAQHSPNNVSKPIMIKSICDFGDSVKDDNYQEYAAYTSAQFTYNFIIEELM